MEGRIFHARNFKEAASYRYKAPEVTTVHEVFVVFIAA
jgi:hypothetical protein